MKLNNCDFTLRIRYLIVFVLFIFTALFIHLHKDTAIPANRPFSTFPVQIGEWRMSAESFMTGNVLKVLKPTDYLWRIYENRNGERVTIYLGYHSGSRNEGGVHSPKHCLPGSGWYEVYSKKSKMETSSGSINFVKSLYQKAEESELFLYWFQVIGRTLDNEYSLKLFEIINSSIHHRKDAAFVRISIPIKNSEAGAVRLGESFIRDFYPVISSYLPS